MARSAPRPCGHPGCARLVHGETYCECHAPQHKREFEQRRGSSTQRGYGYRWQKASRAFLARHPLCRYCEHDGRIAAATVVDHIVPHHGDQALFWDADNWQPLCKSCHDRRKQSEERQPGPVR